MVGDGHISGDMVDSELITSSGTIITQALRHLEERYGGALAYARVRPCLRTGAPPPLLNPCVPEITAM